MREKFNIAIQTSHGSARTAVHGRYRANRGGGRRNEMLPRLVLRIRLLLRRKRGRHVLCVMLLLHMVCLLLRGWLLQLLMNPTIRRRIKRIPVIRFHWRFFVHCRHRGCGRRFGIR